MAIRRAWGEGTYSETKDGGWAWRGYYQDPITGVKKRKWLQAKTKNELKSKVQEWQADQAIGRAGTRIKVRDWARVWLQQIVGDSVKPRTVEAYEVTVRNHILPPFGEMWLDAITTATLQGYMVGLKNLSAATQATVKRHWRLFFGGAMDYGYLIQNPALRVRTAKIEARKTTALSSEEIQRLRAVAKSGEYRPAPQDPGEEYLSRCYHVLIELALSTEAREGELFGLAWACVDKRQGTIRIEATMMNSRRLGLRLAEPKSKAAQRTIKIPATVAAILEKWRQWQAAYAVKYRDFYQNELNLVFSNSLGRPLLTANFLQRAFYPMLKAAGIQRGGQKLNMHTLRHTHASQLLAVGVNPLAVSQRLGHSSPAVTLNIYAHLLPQTVNDAEKALNALYGNSIAENQESEKEEGHTHG